MQTKFLLPLAVSAAALLLLTTGKGDSMNKNQPRGIRNNNPGNIEDNGVSWQGHTGKNDGRFIIFSDPKFGIRAISKILQTYSAKYGINTLDGIINRWAPPFENDTNAYIAHAEKALNISRFSEINKDHYPELIKVIIQHENGKQPYSNKVIYDGIALS